MIWLLLLVPAIFTSVFYIVPFFRKNTKWWEPIISFVVTIIVIIICQTVAISNAEKDKEYWGEMAMKVVHEEPFAYDSECMETYPCGTDSEGYTQYCTRWVHCVENSPRQTYFVDSRKNVYPISYDKYKTVIKNWNNNKYGNSIIITKSHGYTTKGDKYHRKGHGNKHWVIWPINNWEKSEPIITIHSYKNRLQTTSNWSKIKEEDVKEYKLYNYPEVKKYTTNSVLSTNQYPKSNKYFTYLNGWLNTVDVGYKKIRIWVLVFDNQTQYSGELQRQYWKGANKNEFVIMFGVNNTEITWVDIITWSESDTLIIETRDKLLLEMKDGKNGYSGKLTDKDLLKFAKWFGKEAREKYILT